MNQARFLILRGGAVGDLILTLPVLQTLRNRWPDCHIELVGYPRTNALVESAGLADKTHSLDGAGIVNLYIPKVNLPLEMARWLSEFSLAIHFLSSVDVSQNLREFMPQVIPCHPMPPQGVHATDHYLSALEELAIFESGLAPRIIALAESVEPAPVAIHPGSGGAHKIWPLERYLELATHIESAHGIPVLWLLGEADHRIARQLDGQVPDCQRIENRPLTELARVLAGCRLFIGNDSGVAHLAAAVGTPVVVLFGPTDPAQWAPRGPQVQVVRSESGLIGYLEADLVRAAVDANLAEESLAPTPEEEA